MFNPSQFVRNNNIAIQPSSRIILEKIVDNSKSRWDQPITVPDVLYQKFKLPIPQSSKQSKKYPLSLIDFVKRAYSKCKDQIQARAMESQLRKIISKQYDNLDAVNWEEVPLPSLTQSQRRSGSNLNLPRDQIIKKDISSTPKKQVQSIGTKEELQIQPKLKVSMTLQKLEEKLSKKQQGKLEEKKTFIGFSNEPQNYQPPPIRSEISPHLRTLFINNPTPSPPPPPLPPPLPIPQKKQPAKEIPKKQVEVDSTKNKSKQLDQKFIKATTQKNSKDKILNVITSIQPETIKQKKQNVISVQSPAPSPPPKQKGKIAITRKQLTQITKAAQKPSDVFAVAKRYESFNKLKAQTIKSIDEIDQDDEDFNQIIIGRSTRIDKPYLRITGRPDPDTVRPQGILKKALHHFMIEHKNGTTPYDALISQFKSIRQDLTVQHIRNSLTVEVYEQNFKMSLFQNDIIQVKNCQANLWQLYRQGLYRSIESRDKFISYNFITLILEQKYMELEYMLTLLPKGTIEQKPIQQSLKLKKIFLLGNYRAFFDFYNSRDEICRKLLNFYIDKIRMKCLVMFSKTCGQKMTFGLLGETIGQDEDVLQTLATSEGAIIRQGYFMLKQSYQKLSKSDFLVIKKVTNLLI